MKFNTYFLTGTKVKFINPELRFKINGNLETFFAHGRAAKNLLMTIRALTSFIIPLQVLHSRYRRRKTRTGDEKINKMIITFQSVPPVEAQSDVLKSKIFIDVLTARKTYAL